MRLVTNIFVVILAILVGGLSTGFTVYHMNCTEACPSGLYLQNPHEAGDSCGKMKQSTTDDYTDKEEKSCCSKSKEKPQEEKGDCCDVKELKVFKSFEFASFLSINIEYQDPDQNIDFLEIQDCCKVNERYTSTISYRGPPDKISLSGKKIRILISSLQYDGYFLS